MYRNFNFTSDFLAGITGRGISSNAHFPYILGKVVTRIHVGEWTD
jgi:hypothetical protein